MIRNLLMGLCMVLFTSAAIYAQGDFQLRKIGTFHTGIFDEGSAEIVAYDANNKRAFFTNADANAVTVVDLNDPYHPTLIAEISQDSYGAGVNSLAVYGDLVAVAVEADAVDAPGKVVFWSTDGAYVADVEVGILPDMVTFSNDGNYVVVANEGEPNDDYTVDPEGSVSIIDMSNGAASATVAQVDFGVFTDANFLRSLGVRIYGPNATPAQDLEPEYIAISDDSKTAYVNCQENNVILEVDLETATINVANGFVLGTKDHSLPGNGLDASNRDDSILITNYPIAGLYLPDAIVYHRINGTGYILTANEGDSRDYDGYSEEERVKDLTLDPTAYPNAADLQEDEVLGRLKVTSADGDTDGDGDIDLIHSYGARSFTIWSTDGTIIFDSGDEFERKLAEYNPMYFNSNNDENDFDSRSDDKGPEPEAIEVAEIGNDVYAIIGLERVGGLMVYNITDPANAYFVSYVNNRIFYANPEGRVVGDLGPESIKFVPEWDSPIDLPLVITANEVSGTMTVFAVNDTIKDIIFDEEIEVESYTPTEVVVPPSPLETQVVFVGGHDIVQTTPTYGNPAGRAIAKEWHDFIGYTPDETGNTLGWISVNHEMVYRDDKIGDGGGMTVFQVGKDANGQIEVLDQTLTDGRSGQFFNVDFVNTVGETGMNCAGISAPDGRIWTAEEWYRGNQASIWNSSARTSSLPLRVNSIVSGYGLRDTADFTIDAPEFPLVDGMSIKKYENFNYMVEIDPKEAKAIRKQYNWGRAGWEGGAITEDMKTVYLGIDATPAPWVKYEADVAGDFTSGTLYVFKHDNDEGERWIAVPETVDNVFGGLSDFAWSVGATMFVRNEWVTIDHNTGLVYWTETGRDSGSSGPGRIFNAAVANTDAVPAPHHEALALSYGLSGATDTLYQDYYGRVLYYDPISSEVGVAVNGGPFFESSPTEENYPDIHLSNPDGLNVIEIDGQNFLMISEDLNGSSNGRTPEGVSNRMCELYLLDTRKIPATTDDLVRVTAVPQGAEITGAIQIDNNTILFNSQHPNPGNPFPYNHSLTMAIHGFQSVTLDRLQNPTDEAVKSEGLLANEITRELFLKKTTDAALYDEKGKRLRVFRKRKQINLGGLDSGTYFLVTEDEDVYKLNVL